MRQKRPQTFHGQRAFAKAVGVSQPRISQLIAGGRIHAKPSYTEQDVTSAKAMLIESRATNNATAAMDGDDDPETAVAKLKLNPERLARVKFLIEKTAKVKLERELLAGGYMRKEEIEHGRLSRVYSVRAKLAELPLRASLLVGKTEAEIESILRDFAKEVCNHYAEGGN